MLQAIIQSCFFSERQSILKQYFSLTTLTNTTISKVEQQIEERRPSLPLSLSIATASQPLLPKLKRSESKLKKMSSEKPKIIFVLGGPGAGKGTQCANIVKHFDFGHLSAGDLLREERAREGSEVGALIEDYIRNGKIVPVEVTCSLIEAAMNKSDQTKFLIDGFPRNQDNLDGWNRQMADKVDFQFVLFFNCSEAICVERCLNRGQSGSGRSDDNMESLKKRIQTYNNDSLPIIKYFDNLGKVITIDASRSADKVFDAVVQQFKANGFCQ